MMVLNHGFTGYVAGRVVYPALDRFNPLSSRQWGWCFFLGGMAPDLDMIARLFGRMAYFSTDWYGHRQASHSILGTLLLGMLVAGLLSGFSRLKRGNKAHPGLQTWLWMTGCVWAGGMLHALCDMFTPGRPMAFFWPLGDLVGGWRHIGWFTPYILVLFLAIFAMESVIRLAGRWNGWISARSSVLGWGLYLVAGARLVQFIAVSRYEDARQYNLYQSALLPEPLLLALNQGVRTVWVWLAG